MTLQPFDVAPIDYEIVSIGLDAEPELIGRFDDVSVRSKTPERFVCGYLSLESRGDAVLVQSHGHEAVVLSPLPGSMVASAPGGFAPLTPHCWLATGAGIAIESDRPPADAGYGDGSVRLPRPFRAALVHGPAPEKVRARLAVLQSLRRVGGRRG